MRRFWLEPQNWDQEQLQVSGELFHHLIDVCRFEVGDKFELLSTGQAVFVEILSVDKRHAQLRRLEVRQIGQMPKPHIHLALSVPRFAKVDWIVEKSVELGIHEIHPFVSDHSFVRDPAQVPAAKVARWRKLVQQASQQSGRGELMGVAQTTTLQALLTQVNQKPKTLCLFPFEGECELTLKQRLKGLKPTDFEEIWVFVGSEGGFSRAEVESFKVAQIAPVSLGAQVLRVETACLALASILKYEFEVVEHGSI
ncbi:MAG: 16S rRNA (uracil(1498)-N(3))-methyltransferase [Bdellovibrionales bacterium]